MTDEAICKLQLPKLADNSVLFLWAIAAHLPAALKVIEAWGFEYKEHFVWAKGETVLQFHGTGPWSIQYVNPDDDPRKRKDGL